MGIVWPDHSLRQVVIQPRTQYGGVNTVCPARKWQGATLPQKRANADHVTPWFLRAGQTGFF